MDSISVAETVTDPRREDQGTMGAVKTEATVLKWENGRTPADGEHDDVASFTYWSEANGEIVTDPERIAFLEASISKENTNGPDAFSTEPAS